MAEDRKTSDQAPRLGVLGKEDLAEREVAIELDLIPEEQRRPESEIWKAFEQDQPKILGALLTAVACGLRHSDALTDRKGKRSDANSGGVSAIIRSSMSGRRISGATVIRNFSINGPRRLKSK
jgi:hypothetical protein